MKKILSICLVLLTSFALCACSSEEGKETNNQTKTEEKIYGVGETITYKKDGQERVHFTFCPDRCRLRIRINRCRVGFTDITSFINHFKINA